MLYSQIKGLINNVLGRRAVVSTVSLFYGNIAMVSGDRPILNFKFFDYANHRSKGNPICQPKTVGRVMPPLSGKRFHFKGRFTLMTIEQAHRWVRQHNGQITTGYIDAHYFVFGHEVDNAAFLYFNPGTIPLTEEEFLELMGITIRTTKINILTRCYEAIWVSYNPIAIEEFALLSAN